MYSYWTLEQMCEFSGNRPKSGVFYIKNSGITELNSSKNFSTFQLKSEPRRKFLKYYVCIYLAVCSYLLKNDGF